MRIVGGRRGLAMSCGVVLAIAAAGCQRAPLPERGSPTGAALTSSGPLSSSVPATPPVPGFVTVAGHRILATGLGDIADAIRHAGVTVPDGRLMSVLGDRVLDAHASSATVLINGRQASMSAGVHPGDTITFIPAKDTVETTQTMPVPLYLNDATAALYASYVPGTSTVVEGAVSGEQVSSVIASAPRIGPLRSSARFALTIDDGPNPPWTGEILSLLAEHHAPAVFCLIGVQATSFPSVANQEALAGYRMCDHTQTHPLDLPELTPGQIRAQISSGAQSITTSDGGIRPVYFRAPGGNWSPTITADARELHLIPLHWTVDPRDWSMPGTQAIILSVLNQLRPEGIILMHDGGGDRSQTVAALTVLLGELQSAGWIASLPTWVS